MKRSLRWLVLGCFIFMLLAAYAPAGAEGALFEAEAALQEGEAPTLFSVYPSADPAEDWPDDPALQVQVTPPDGEPYSFVFPSYEGYETGSLLPLLSFADINGDGFVDVEALFALGASNMTSTYYLYDPADHRLHYSQVLGALSNAIYDPQEHIILSQVSDGAARQYYTLFGLRDGAPVLLRTACIMAVLTGETYVLQTGVSSAVTGAVLLDESVPFAGDESAVWNAQYEGMMQALLANRESDLNAAQP